jgi:hypothetical protein
MLTHMHIVGTFQRTCVLMHLQELNHLLHLGIVLHPFETAFELLVSHTNLIR